VKSLPKIDVVPLFPAERAALLDLLRSLTPEQWGTPTVCAGWSVKDIAAHLVADDLGRLGWQRDGHSANRFEPTSPETFETELRDFINAQNELWVQAARRFSPRVIMDLLQWTGPETQVLFESLDPDAIGLGVTWAGESESANWFDLAREYTERWHHQAQIRDAVGAPMLYDERLFVPVLQTMSYAIPHALHEYDAPVGTLICINIGDITSWAYDIYRDERGWSVCEGNGPPNGVISMTGDTAWRMLTRNLPREEIAARIRVDGDSALVAAVLDAFALVA
jgi:uncharacterized protein (TIGR03083 family)